MALRRFIARRGTPAELWLDQGTNFRGGQSELREAYAALVPDIQCQLARQRIHFHFNPPSAPHFGGVWEREVRPVKLALYTVLGSQSVPEEVLMTVLLEVEAILNSKPLGYVSSDVVDADPVTPCSLLMGSARWISASSRSPQIGDVESPAQETLPDPSRPILVQVHTGLPP